MAPLKPLLKNLGVVGVASVIGQALPLLAVPWLTRLYGPLAFGVYGLFFATAMTLSLVATGRFEMAVPGAKNDEEAARLILGSLLVLAFVTAAVTILCAVGWDIFRISYPMWPLWLGGALVLAAGAMQSLNCWFIRKEQFISLSAVRIVQAVAASAGSVAIGYATSQPWGLALGAVLGQVLGATVALVLAMPQVARASRALTVLALRKTLTAHLEYPRVNAPHALLDGVRESGLQAGFAWLFGSAANGMYALSARVLRFPASFVAGSIGQVLFGRLAKDARDGSDSRALLWRVAIGVGGASVLPFGALVALGPEIFAWVFGENWREAGEYARIMAPALWLGFAVAPITSMPLVAGRMRGAFMFALLDLAVRGIALGVGKAAGAPLVAIEVLTAGSAVIYCALFFWYLRLATRQRRNKVVFLGQSRWSRLLAEQLALLPDARERTSFAAVALDRPWSALRPSNISNVFGADVLVRVGFRPAGDTPFGRAFASAWAFLRSLRPTPPVIMYWIGTDVSRSRVMLERGRNRGRFLRAVSSERHIAGSPNLVEELRMIGVSAQLMWFPGLPLRAPEKVPAMPECFRVLAYVPDARPEFYGGRQLVALAKALPEIEIRVAGGDGRWLAEKPPNMTFLGWVHDMAAEYAASCVVVRLVEHDALGATAIEGLLYGRYVIYSGELQDADRIAIGDEAGLIDHVMALRRKFLEGQLPPRQDVADRARRDFDQRNRLAALWSYLEACR